MEYTLKNISHFDFFEACEKIMTELEELTEAEDDSIKLSEFKIKVDRLIEKTQEHFYKHLNPNPEEIIKLLTVYHDRSFDFDLSSFGFEKESELNKEISRLNRFKKNLKLTTGYLSTIETLFNPHDSIVIDSITDKNDFILSKLNVVFGDEIYSIGIILDLNNVKYRDSEPREIAEDLSKRGYVILKDRYGNSDKVKISVKGAAYIERKNKKKIITKTKNDLDKKLDNIIDHLTKLGFGQEIIFNEIDELRVLQHKLSKKSWSQLLKGKLVGLALDKIINTEVAKSIYEYLTNNNFKLLK